MKLDLKATFIFYLIPKKASFICFNKKVFKTSFLVLRASNYHVTVDSQFITCSEFTTHITLTDYHIQQRHYVNIAMQYEPTKND